MNEQLKEAIARFEDVIAHQVNDKNLPSISYALADRNGPIATGYIQPDGADKTLTDASMFRIGSVTKMFTTISLMQLAEKGLVDIDADITTYIPHFTPHNPFADAPGGTLGSHVSLRKLMSHTAGIKREPKSGHYLDSNRPSLTETVDELAGSTLKHDPSMGVFSYSNAGIAVVGSVIERISGQSYEDYVHQHIFKPLKMNDSSLMLTQEVRERLAPAFMWTVDEDIPAPVFGLGGAPAGNIFSTAPDMAVFAATLLRGGYGLDGTQLLRPDTLNSMWQPVGGPINYRGMAGYGLAFSTGVVNGWPSVGHAGAVYGYSTYLTLLPHAGLAVIVFSTLDYTNQITGQLAVRGLEAALAGRNMGKMPPRPEPVKSATQDQIDQLSGHYVNADEVETADISVANGRFYLMGDGMPFEIRPVNDTNFIIDGRLQSEGGDYPHRDVCFPEPGIMEWKGAKWQKRAAETLPPPAELAPHLGEYGPDFNITRLYFSDGKLKCLIEYFSTHECEPLGDDCYRMHGTLYEGETLELGVNDENGAAGIRVGPMFMERRK